VPLGATNGFVQNSIGRSVEGYSEKVHYFCRNVLQVEYAFCLAKVTARSKSVHHRIGMKINGRDLLWMALLRSHGYLFTLFRCFCVLVSTMYE
jgi:hypothetical protein